MSLVSVEDYERLARERLRPEVWDFIAGGAGAEKTLAANLGAFDRVRLRPRVMVDVSAIRPATTLFGARLAAPLGVAPTAYHQLVHPDAELGTAIGAGRSGALYVVSIFASRTVAGAQQALEPQHARRHFAQPGTQRGCGNHRFGLRAPGLEQRAMVGRVMVVIAIGAACVGSARGALRQPRQQ